MKPQTASQQMITRRFGLAIALLALALAAPASWAQDAADEALAAETPTHSPIMDVPMDGSSQEALKASMDKVKAEASDVEYKELQKYVGLLNAYDLSLRSNPAALRARLDGKSPLEVIEMVKKRYN